MHAPLMWLLAHGVAHRLTFPGQVVEDGREKAAYDAATGELLVHIPKAIPGEHFPDLDLLTTLLARKPAAPSGRANVEVLGGSTDGTRPRLPLARPLSPAPVVPPHQRCAVLRHSIRHGRPDSVDAGARSATAASGATSHSGPSSAHRASLPADPLGDSALCM